MGLAQTAGVISASIAPAPTPRKLMLALYIAGYAEFPPRYIFDSHTQKLVNGGYLSVKQHIDTPSDWEVCYERSGEDADPVRETWEVTGDTTELIYSLLRRINNANTAYKPA